MVTTVDELVVYLPDLDEASTVLGLEVVRLNA